MLRGISDRRNALDRFYLLCRHESGNRELPAWSAGSFSANVLPEGPKSATFRRELRLRPGETQHWKRPLAVKPRLRAEAEPSHWAGRTVVAPPRHTRKPAEAKVRQNSSFHLHKWLRDMMNEQDNRFSTRSNKWPLAPSARRYRLALCSAQRILDGLREILNLKWFRQYGAAGAMNHFRKCSVALARGGEN